MRPIVSMVFIYPLSSLFSLKLSTVIDWEMSKCHMRIYWSRCLSKKAIWLEALMHLILKRSCSSFLTPWEQMGKTRWRVICRGPALLRSSLVSAATVSSTGNCWVCKPCELLRFLGTLLAGVLGWGEKGWVHRSGAGAPSLDIFCSSAQCMVYWIPFFFLKLYLCHFVCSHTRS